MLNRLLSLTLLVFLFAGLSACGGGGESGEGTATEGAETEGTEAAGEASTGGEMLVELGPVGNEMKYDKTEFTVSPGQQVRIVFRNTATSPAMSHNVVVLRNREAIERVGQAGMAAGEANGYVPEDADILAHTPLSKPGETVEVTFTAPSEAGDYPYICTFPGHYMLMQGTMRVQ